MTTHYLKKNLRQLKAIVPNADWQSARRDLLLQQIQAQTQIKVAPVLTTWERVKANVATFESGLSGVLSAIAARSITVGVLLFVMLFGTSGYLVAAADKSLPGESLYSLKTTVEEARLAFARTPKARIKLQVEFADRRLSELSRLAKVQGAELRIATLVTQFESSVSRASSDVSKLSESAPSAGADVAKLVDDRISMYQHSLKEAGEGSNADVSKRVSKALAVVSKAGTDALKVIVEDSTVQPSEEIAKKLDDKIKLAEEALVRADAKLAGGAKGPTTDVAKTKSSDAKDNLAVAKKKVIEGDYRAAITILSNVEDIVIEVTDSADEAAGEGEVKGVADELPTTTDETGAPEKPTDGSETK